MEISDKDINELIDAPKIGLSSDNRKHVFTFIKTNWKTRKTVKPIEKIKTELKHSCSKSILQSQVKSLNDRLNEAKKAGLTAEEYVNFNNSLLDSIGLVFIDGPFFAFKENFTLDKEGNIVGLALGDKTRWGKECNTEIADYNLKRRHYPSEQTEASASAAWYAPMPPLPPSPLLSADAQAKIAQTKAKVLVQGPRTRAGRRKRKNRKTRRLRR